MKPSPANSSCSLDDIVNSQRLLTLYLGQYGSFSPNDVILPQAYLNKIIAPMLLAITLKNPRLVKKFPHFKETFSEVMLDKRDEVFSIHNQIAFLKWNFLEKILPTLKMALSHRRIPQYQDTAA